MANPEWLYVAHMVPLANTHRSGAWRWDPAKKRRYANSIPHLFLTGWDVNERRGNKGPDEWRPFYELYWCGYAKDWIRTKRAWELTSTPEENKALQEMLATCRR